MLSRHYFCQELLNAMLKDQEIERKNLSKKFQGYFSQR
jgi:hypothetical protein